MNMSEDEIYELEIILKHAHNYLNKMNQWKQGKIDLAVPGCDPPRVMSDDELINDFALIREWMRTLDELSID